MTEGCALYTVFTGEQSVGDVQMEEERRLRTAVQAQLESLSVAKARKTAERQAGLKK